jgi:hypothetical protein
MTVSLTLRTRRGIDLAEYRLLRSAATGGCG